MIENLAWPVGIAIAWLFGEIGLRWLSLPRISSYGIAGFFLASSQFGVLPSPDNAFLPGLANLAFALILFELGYRINLRWLRANPWIGRHQSRRVSRHLHCRAEHYSPVRYRSGARPDARHTIDLHLTRRGGSRLQ